jgi:hypothetical protein
MGRNIAMRNMRLITKNEYHFKRLFIAKISIYLSSSSSSPNAKIFSLGDEQ